MTSRNIPSAGPWLTDLEMKYVQDACANGWYENWDGYLDRFSRQLNENTATKFALPTSSCTGALHLAVKAIGLKPDDEVIIPEVTWIATVSAVCYERAKPVFVDVESDTWCIDPLAIERAITPKTKAIIPVHMYGHPANMDAIGELATAYGLKVIEDAAPGIGSKYFGRPTGGLGDIGVFSFQGAKPLVMGEGGALVTNDENIFEKAKYYWDHCREPGQILYNSNIGLKYKLSNIQAALGLAQLEREDEIIAKRRKIYFWYKERLSEIQCITMNIEREGYFNNFYVPTIIIKSDARVERNKLMNELSDKGINNRPFFRPLSKFPMFSNADTPVADKLAENGLNLPCASVLEESEIDYVCSTLKSILK